MNADPKAKKEAEAQAKVNADAKAKAEAEAKAKAETDAKAKKEAEAKADDIFEVGEFDGLDDDPEEKSAATDSDKAKPAREQKAKKKGFFARVFGKMFGK